MSNVSDFSSFEKIHYSFHLFSSLVKDLVIKRLDLSVPYDTEMQIIHKSYCSMPELADDSKVTPYEHAVIHINSDAQLEQALKQASD